MRSSAAALIATVGSVGAVGVAHAHIDPNWLQYNYPLVAEWQQLWPSKVDTKHGPLGNPVIYGPITLGSTQILGGTGLPVVGAPQGSFYTRTDAAPGASLYVKESGAGAAGRVPYAAPTPIGSTPGTVADGGALAVKAQRAQQAGLSAVSLMSLNKLNDPGELDTNGSFSAHSVAPIGRTPDTLANLIASRVKKSGSTMLLGQATPPMASTAGLTVQNTDVTEEMIYGALTPPGWFTADGMRVSLVAPTGATAQGTDAFGFYVRNQTVSSGLGGNGVGLFGTITCEVNNCASWGINPTLIDGPVNGVLGNGTGRKLIGAEFDISATQTGTAIQGISLLGSSTLQPLGADGFSCGPLGGPALWKHCFVEPDGVGTGGIYLGSIGATATPNSPSVAIDLTSYGPTGAPGLVRLQASQGALGVSNPNLANGLGFVPAVAGSAVLIGTNGTDTAVPLNVITKGGAPVTVAAPVTVSGALTVTGNVNPRGIVIAPGTSQTYGYDDESNVATAINIGGMHAGIGIDMSSATIKGVGIRLGSGAAQGIAVQGAGTTYPLIYGDATGRAHLGSLALAIAFSDGNLLPVTGDAYSLGTSGQMWNAVFAQNVTTGKISASGVVIIAQHTPASSTEACSPGQTSDDASYHYWCATQNHWLRVAGSPF